MWQGGSNFDARGLRALVWVGLVCGLWPGCRCASDTSPAALDKPSVVTSNCERVGVSLTLAPSALPARAVPSRAGSPKAALLKAAPPKAAPPGPAPTPTSTPVASDAGPDTDPGVDLPFSIEPGMALGLGARFFATALRHDPQGSTALLARLPATSEAGAAEPFELGRSEGDVPPPRLAVDGNDLLVALEAPVPGGYQIRIARWSRADLAAPLALPPVWRDGPRASLDESNAFDFAASDGRAIVVWDDWPRGESHGRVFVSVLEAAGSAAPLAAPSAASAPGVDAEEPRVVARPGGYWLAWLVNSVPTEAANHAVPAPVPAAGAAAGRSRIYDPGEEESEAPAAAKPSSGARYIEVVALDAAGHPAGEVRRLAEPSRVVGYDLSTTAAGHAWLVWRQDAPSPGAAGGRVSMAEVRNEGAQAVLPVREEDVGSGEPSWLGAGPGAIRWLTFPDQRDRTLLLPVEYPLPVAPPLTLDAELGAASALTAGAGQMLFARPRGRALELFVARCSAPPRPVAAGPEGG